MIEELDGTGSIHFATIDIYDCCALSVSMFNFKNQVYGNFNDFFFNFQSRTVTSSDNG